MSSTENKPGFQTIRPSSYRAMSAKTLNPRESRMHTRELEARNKMLKSKLKGNPAEKDEQIQQLKMLIAAEEEALLSKESEIKFYERKIDMLNQ